MKNTVAVFVLLMFILSSDPSAAATPSAANITARKPIKTISGTTNQIQGSTIPQTSAHPLDLTKFSISKAGVLLPNAAQTKLACGQTPNGTILVTWATMTTDNKHVGEAMFYNDKMEFLRSVYFTFPATTYVVGKTVVLGLTNNTFLIAYNDIKDNTAKYVILKDNGTPLFEPIIFSAANVDSTTLTPLPGNTQVLLSYQKYSDISAQGEYQILDLAGKKVLGPIVFNAKGMGTGMEPIVSEGLITYYFGCGFSRSKTIDMFGNIVRDDTTFYHEANRAYQPVLLANGNSLVLTIDQHYMPMSFLLDTAGNKLSGPTQFLGGAISLLSAFKLNSGHIFVQFNTFTSYLKRHAFFSLLDENGNRIKEEKNIGNEYSISEDMIASTILNDHKALVVYGGIMRDDKEKITDKTTSYMIVNIE
jgi:hypothetical protein